MAILPWVTIIVLANFKFFVKFHIHTKLQIDHAGKSAIYGTIF